MPAGSRTSASIAAVVAVLATGATFAWLSILPPRPGITSIDLFFLFYPAHFHFGQEIAHGHFPIWNAALGLGSNEMADSQFGFFYPPNLLFALLPTALAMDVLAWLHVALAAGAVFLLCVRCGLSAPSAAVGCVAFACGAALSYLANWTTMLATFAWCPVALLAARRLADAPQLGTALALALVLALQLLAGYLQFSLYTMLLLPLFAWPAARPVRPVLVRSLGWIALAALLGVALAAIGVFPALAAVAGSVRERANIPAWFYEVAPVRLASYPPGLAAPALDARIPVFVGVLAPLLALGGVTARGLAPRLRVPALVLLVAALVLSLGTQTPIFPLLWRLPIAHLLTHPHKWVFFFALALALLAAVGGEALRRTPPVAERALWLVLGLVFLALVPFPPLVRAGGLALLLLLVLGAGRLPAWTALALPLVVALTILPAYRVRPQRPTDNLNYFVRSEDAYRYLASRQDAGRTFILTPEMTGSPRQGEVAGVAQVTTNGTFLSVRLDRYMFAVREAVHKGERERAVGLLRAAGSHFVLGERVKTDWLAELGLKPVFDGGAAQVWEDPAALPRTYLARQVRLVPAARALEAIADPRVAAEHAVVLEDEDGPLAAGQPAADAAGTARLVAATPDLVRVAVDTPAAAVLVLLDAWSPEWRATVDGQPVPIRHANLVARAVEVPAGAHEVVFRFVPGSFYAGAATSLAALLALVIGAGVVRVRVRRAAAPRARTSPSRR